jgi:PAS domain S-box-containing protein
LNSPPASTWADTAASLDTISTLYPAVLTRQQGNVLRFVVHGRSSREIADTLVISERTVHHHIRDVYERIGVRNRAEAVAFVFERAAEAQRAWLATVVTSSVDAIIGRDLNGIITRWSPAAEALYGYTEQEALAQSIMLLAPPNRVAEMEQRIASLKRGEAIPALETQRRRKDGAIIDVSISSRPVWNIDGQLVGSAITMRDITQRMQVAAERDRLAAVVASADDAIMTRALDGTITSWNAAAERLFGYCAEEVIGQPTTFLVPADRTADSLQVLTQFQGGARIVHMDTVRRHKDGRRINVSLTVSQVVSANGAVIGVASICRDISKRADGRGAGSPAAPGRYEEIAPHPAFY